MMSNSNTEFLEVLRQSSAGKEALDLQQQREHRLNSAKRRLELIRERKAFCKDNADALRRIDNEIREVEETLREKINERGNLLGLSCTEKARLDTAIGREEAFLKQSAPPHLKEKLAALLNKVYEVPKHPERYLPKKEQEKLPPHITSEWLSSRDHKVMIEAQNKMNKDLGKIKENLDLVISEILAGVN